MRALYTLLMYVVTPLLLLYVLWRGLRVRGYWQRLGERFGLGPTAVTRDAIWVHAVSVGEVNAAGPLIEKLLDRYPETPVVITTFTPTGSDRARALFDDRVLHSYAPVDLPGSIRRFFRRYRPRLLIVLETEIWLNWYHMTHARGVPILMVNARLSAQSVAGYNRWPHLARTALARVDRIAAQSQADAERLQAVGAPPERIEVTGNMKFDLPLPEDANQHAYRLRQSWGLSRPVLVAGSTHEGEEADLLDVFRRLNDPKLLLIIAPRHPERFERVWQLLRQSGFSCRRRSEHENPGQDDRIFLLDSLGELMRYFAAADLAFVGGTLVPVGGHNVLEPAALGVPVITGPYVANCQEQVEQLSGAGAMVMVRSARQMTDVCARLLRNPRHRQHMSVAGAYLVDAGRGAVARNFDLATQLLENRDPASAEPAVDAG